MKRIAVVLLLVLFALTCVACSGTHRGICSQCGQETELHKYVLQGQLGNAMNRGDVEYMCEDCIRLAKLTGY